MFGSHFCEGKMTVNVKFLSAEEWAKAREDLRQIAEEEKRPLPPFVETAMAAFNATLEKDPTLLASFAWAAAVDAILEECAKVAESHGPYEEQYQLGTPARIAAAIRERKSA